MRAAVIPTDVREGELDGDQERSYGHDRARSRAISGYVALARYTHKLNGRQILTTLPEASGPNGQNTATVARMLPRNRKITPMTMTTAAASVNLTSSIEA